MASRDQQLRLALITRPRWGGQRAHAGRKPAGDRAEIRHAPRETLTGRHPAHVTLRVRRGIPSLRSARLVRAFALSLAQASERGDFRVVHYSLQSNHVHLLVEASSREALGCGMKAVSARLARAVNRVFGLAGRVLADRYHLHVLKTPREVRNALRYVLLNSRHHTARVTGAVLLDPASSARWFDGWTRSTPIASTLMDTLERPVARAQTWLLTVGWRRGGLLDPADIPGT